MAFELDTLRRLDGDAGPYEKDIVAWIERNSEDLKQAWETSRAQLISCS